MKIFCILYRLHISDDESNEEEFKQFSVSFWLVSQIKHFDEEFSLYFSKLHQNSSVAVKQCQNSIKIRSLKMPS